MLNKLFGAGDMVGERTMDGSTFIRALEAWTENWGLWPCVGTTPGQVLNGSLASEQRT